MDQDYLSDDPVDIPMIGFGTWVDYQSGESPEIIGNLVTKAINIGYRHFDTANSYFTEPYVIASLLNSGLRRDEYFLTSKLIPSSKSVNEELIEREIQGLNDNLSEIRYFDLLLIHHPPQTSNRNIFKRDLLRQWQRMTKYLQHGVTRTIGVSNFYRNQLDILLEICQEYNLPRPVVNQLEIHPGNFELDYTKYCQEKEITVFAHTPLGGLKSLEVLTNPVLIRISERISEDEQQKVTPAQIILAYNLRRNVGVLPRSSNQQRMKENLESVNLVNKLTDDDIQTLDELDFQLEPMIESSYIDWSYNSQL